MYNILNLLKLYKKHFIFAADFLLVVFSYSLSLYFTNSGSVAVFYISQNNTSILSAILTYATLFFLFGTYNSILVLSSIKEYLKCLYSSVIAYLCRILFIAVFYDFNLFRIKYNTLAFFLIVLFLIGYRVLIRAVLTRKKGLNLNDRTETKKRLLIVGAGAAANIIIKELNGISYDIIGLIDDDLSKLHCTVSGIPIVGTREDIIDICKKKNIEEILLAIPSIDNKNKRKILSICHKTNCKIKITPPLHELIHYTILSKNIRDVDFEDLLARDPIYLDNNTINNYINEKTVLVTGGSGSIGSELCRQIATYSPKKLIVLDTYENSSHDLFQELKYRFPILDLVIIIASVRDTKRLDSIFNKYRPNVVFHAAAHKHVPLMEYNPSEAIKNNVLGTLNTVRCADKHKVEKFVLISTDKAVNPTNVMGATKRICEMIIQSFNKESKTEFVAVRFGNVLGSNGSVIPIFKKQISQGGPVTVTHKEITRYFMTIPEASQLVLQAAAYAKGGEIFVLDMGEPIKIYDLAENLIKLSGFRPNIDIPIEITGLRPGEKLYEELLLSEEGLTKTTHNKIFIARPTEIDFKQLKSDLDVLNILVESEDSELIKVELNKIVPTYKYLKENSSEKEWRVV